MTHLRPLCLALAFALAAPLAIATASAHMNVTTTSWLDQVPAVYATLLGDFLALTLIPGNWVSTWNVLVVVRWFVA